MVRADHPNNEEVCVLIFRESLPVRNFSNSYFSEYVTLEVTTCNKNGYVIIFYRSPSQTFDQFDFFTTNLEKLLINLTSFDPHFELITW